MLELRAERDGDESAIHALNRSAFATAAEADLVATLRREANPFISLVAEDDGDMLGHILFTAVGLAEHPRVPVLGLAPMAVTPARQRQGLGSALVESGLGVCRQYGAMGVVVLGHPDFYRRFGFLPASHFGLHSSYPVPDDVFMALELQPEGLTGLNGLVSYQPAFDAL